MSAGACSRAAPTSPSWSAPARRERLERDGLVIKSTKGDITQKVKTVLGGAEGGPYDVVLLTCKAYDLDSAIEAIAPAVGANTTVVPLLNGMRHIDVLAAKFGDAKVVGGLARVGVALSPEGAILHTSPFAAISFGERGGQPARPRWSSSMPRSRSPASTAACTRTSSRTCGTSGSCCARWPPCAA